MNISLTIHQQDHIKLKTILLRVRQAKKRVPSMQPINPLLVGRKQACDEVRRTTAKIETPSGLRFGVDPRVSVLLI